MRSAMVIFLVFLLGATGCVISPRRTVNSGGGGGGSNTEFSLSTNPSSQSVTAGGVVSFALSVQPQNGFTGTVSFTASPGNATVSANVDPASISGGTGTATLNVVTSSTTPTGNVTISITATDPANNVSTNASVTLVVQSTTAAANASLPVCLAADAGSGAQHATLIKAPDSHGDMLTFSATPSERGMEGSIGFFIPGSTTQQTFSEFVRFSPDGAIQARDGDTFSASTNVPYNVGETYHFRLVKNQPAATYSIFVTPPGEAEVLLGSNLEVPSQNGSINATGFGAAVSSPDDGKLMVCNVTLY